jgi:hypothetical protein
VKYPTAGLLSSRGHKHRPGSQAKAPSASKRRPAPSGLSQDELLAKIDALDWDETISPDTVVAGNSPKKAQYPDDSRLNWRIAAIAGFLVFAVVGLYFLLAPGAPPQPAADQAPTPIAVSAPVTDGTSQQAGSADASLAAVAAAEDRRAALYARAVRDAEAKAQLKVERQRKAREAELARLAAQQERERQQQEEARLRAEREAAEAARVAKARELAGVPKGPTSPQEVCAGESNAFTRGLCEARTCGKTEWRAHPYCQKRLEDQLRALGQGS